MSVNLGSVPRRAHGQPWAQESGVGVRLHTWKIHGKQIIVRGHLGEDDLLD